MKKKMLILIMVCIAFMANAQITIDSTNFPLSSHSIDSQQTIQIYPNPTPEQGKNMNWNYNKSYGFGGMLSTTNYSSPFNKNFKTATISLTQFLPIGTGDKIKDTLYLTDNAGGYAYIGYSIKRQALGVGVNGGSDSLIYQAFDTNYAANPQYIIKYPATYGSHWEYNARLTYPVRFYINPPPSYYYFSGYETIYRSVTDSVVGWGSMEVPNSIDTYQVIMVKENWVDIDSFQIAGLPGYNSGDVQDILDGFNFTQGQQNTSYTYKFYRAGHSNPLMIFAANDSTYQGFVVGGISFDPNNTTPAPTAIKNTPAPTTGLSVSPNPFTTTLSIAYTLPQPQAVQLTLTDITGQQIATLASENQNPGPHTYTLTAAQYSIPPGVYFLRMVAGANAVTQKIVRLR